MDNQNINSLAEKIALLLQTEMPSANSSSNLTLEKLNERLDIMDLEIVSRVQNPKPKTQIPIHFSQQKFTNLEELADEIIAGIETEKACPYEPAGKPCDHCAMCNSRGF